jgi:carbonic anhydrase
MNTLKANLPTSADALSMLIQGNQRYVDAKLAHPHQTPEHCAALSDAQLPFAIILGCADSRVPPEIIFDQGLGDLFVIRVAGNLIDDMVLASIEYAAAHLHTPLMMVLGHTKCGAVSATLAGGELEGHLPGMASLIQPAIDQTHGQPGDPVTLAVKAHALAMAAQIASAAPVLSELVDAGELQVVAACYDIDSRKVEILS